MSEDRKEALEESLNAPEEQEQAPQEETNTFSPEEEKAMKNGWTTKDVFIESGGDPADWKTARAFNEKGEMIDLMRDQKRALSEANKQIEALVAHNQQTQAYERQRAMEYYKAQFKEAVELGEVETAEKINQQMVNEAQQAGAAQSAVDPYAMEFANKNADWFNQDTPENVSMSAYAVAMDNNIQRLNPNIPSEERYKQIDAAVRKQFAYRFTEQGTETVQTPARPQVVIGQAQGAKNATAPKNSKFTLTDEEKRVVAAFKEQIPGYTTEKYIKERQRMERGL
jgi:hypothetical protein